jgi:hypothetical protein
MYVYTKGCHVPQRHDLTVKPPTNGSRRNQSTPSTASPNLHLGRAPRQKICGLVDLAACAKNKHLLVRSQNATIVNFQIARHHFHFHTSQHDRCRPSSTSPRMSSYCRLQGHTTSRQWKAHDYWYVCYGIVGCWFKSKFRADA